MSDAEDGQGTYRYHYGDPGERHFPIGPTRDDLVKQVHSLTTKVQELEERLAEVEDAE